MAFAAATTDTASANIARGVRVLMGIYGENQGHLATLLGMNISQVSRRLSYGAKWSPDELDALARHYDVPVGFLFLSRDELLARLRSSGYKSVNGVVMEEEQMELPLVPAPVLTSV